MKKSKQLAISGTVPSFSHYKKSSTWKPFIYNQSKLKEIDIKNIFKWDLD